MVNLRRRSMLEEVSGSDFVQCDYIQCPSSSPKDAMIILPQVFNDISYVMIDCIITYNKNSIIFCAYNGSSNAPYCGASNSGMSRAESLSVGSRKTYTFTKTSTSHGTYNCKIGGWNDNTFSKTTSYYGLKMYDSNDNLIADYVFGYLNSTGETGAYDTLTNQFIAESGSLEFVRG